MRRKTDEQRQLRSYALGIRRLVGVGFAAIGLAACAGAATSMVAHRGSSGDVTDATQDAAFPSPAWLRANVSAMRLPPFEDNDFDDLEPLRAIVGNARVVALGEESHGDGTAFRTKARLVRFLHERLGFDVLVFESAILDCEDAATKLRHGADDPIETVQSCVASLWSRTNELQPFVEYLAAQPRTPHGLELAGFDLASRRNTVDHLRSAFLSLGLVEPTGTEPWATLGTVFSAIRDNKKDEVAAHQQRAIDSLRDLKGLLKSQRTSERIEILNRSLESAEVFVAYHARMLSSEPVDGGVAPASRNNPRDEGMARNAIWLAERRYGGKKLILWGASFHFVRAHDSIVPLPELDYRGLVPMGEILSRHFQRELISIACIADDGWVSKMGRGREPVDKHGPDAFESLLTGAGFENAIVDLRHVDAASAQDGGSFVAGPLGYGYMRARWGDAFDAFVFNRHMEPSTLRPNAKEADGGTDGGR